MCTHAPVAPFIPFSLRTGIWHDYEYEGTKYRVPGIEYNTHYTFPVDSHALLLYEAYDTRGTYDTGSVKND